LFGIATGYRLDDKRGESSSPCRVKNYFLSTSAHPASYSMGTGSYFPGGKAARSEANHSTPTIAEVIKMWIYTSTPPYTFMV
jgi:hypothetical protein